MYSASPCPCGQKTCKDWHVDGVAAVQGVHFTQQQAKAVATLLNAMEKSPNAVRVQVLLMPENPKENQVEAYAFVPKT